MLPCICDLTPYIFENIHGTKPPNRGYCKTCYIDLIVGNRDWRTAMKISEHSHIFWYALCLVGIRNPGPVCFERMRFQYI